MKMSLKEILGKKITVFGKTIPAFLVVSLLSAGLGSAALLTYYGRITGTANVQQSVVFSDNTTTKTYSFNGNVMAGDSYTDLVSIKNRANVPASAKFITTGDEVVGITTTYWKQVGYTDTKTTPDGTGTIPATIRVEDLVDSVRWTIDIDETSEYVVNGGSAALMIGVGDQILYQVHPNDGVCSEYPFQTWLYSEYENGWHTGGVGCGETNTLVEDMSEINTTGAIRDEVNNPLMIYTITISKSKLHPGEFKWAVALFGRTSNTFSPGTFSWGDTNTNNFHTATLGTEIPEDTAFTIGAGETIDFAIVNEFDVALEPDTYTITTDIVPA